MSREIKLRIWSKSQNKYMDGPQRFAWAINDGLTMEMYIPQDLDGIFEEYTGLKDKNGKEIYEGDIVEEDIDFNSKMTDGAFRYKVYWNEDELCWSLDPTGPESIHNDLWELNSSCRIVGNIHENPELIGDEE